ncbi:hypothetical protein ASG11_17875 [Sphingomonas sp. Leaf357]|nr:hypothetical protein ASG11_17875 [Sphingomonas sp. Leaf357]
MVGKAERVIIGLAVEVLRRAVDGASARPVNTVSVRLALRCLLPHCEERWPLIGFWESAGQTNEIGRCQGVTSSLNGILVQLKRRSLAPD